MQFTVTVAGQTAITTGAAPAGIAPLGGMAPVAGLVLGDSASQQYSPLYNGSRLTKARRVSTARLVFLADPTFSVPMLSRILIDGGGSRHLNGFVLSSRVRYLAPGLRQVEIEGADHHWLMARKFFTKSYSGQSDRAILIDIVAVAGLTNDVEATSATIEIIEASLTLEFTATSARDAFDKVCAVTGGEWYVSQADPPVIYYRSPGAAPAAAFNVSDEPDNSTTFELIDLEVETQQREPINDVRVLGGIVSDVRVDVSAEDATAKAAAGRVFHKQVVDSSILSDAVAELVADNILLRSANPLVSLSFDTFKDGLEPDTEIEVTAADFGLSADAAVIQLVTIEQITPTLTRYSIECGDHFPDLPEALRGLSQSAEVEQAAPNPDGGGAISTYVQELGVATLSGGTFDVSLATIVDVKSAMAFPVPSSSAGETFTVEVLTASSFRITSSNGSSTSAVGWNASGFTS